MTFFRLPCRVSSYLVRTKLYPLKTIVGSIKYGRKRCEVCKNINNSDSFDSSVTGKYYKTNHCFNCDSKCLIYLY